jgi:hypothetical protein
MPGKSRRVSTGKLNSPRDRHGGRRQHLHVPVSPLAEYTSAATERHRDLGIRIPTRRRSPAPTPSIHVGVHLDHLDGDHPHPGHQPGPPVQRRSPSRTPRSSPTPRATSASAFGTACGDLSRCRTSGASRTPPCCSTSPSSCRATVLHPAQKVTLLYQKGGLEPLRIPIAGRLLLPHRQLRHRGGSPPRSRARRRRGVGHHPSRRPSSTPAIKGLGNAG